MFANGNKSTLLSYNRLVVAQQGGVVKFVGNYSRLRY